MHRISALGKRVSGDGSDAWAVHMEAVERKRAGQPIVILSIGQEMQERTPEPIIEAAVDSLRLGRHHYSEIPGEPHLREAIAREFSGRSGVEVSAANCIAFAGAQNALFAASLCLLGDGDEVIVVEPYYATYQATFTAGGARFVPLPTDPLHDFQFDLELLRNKVTDRTRAVVVNSPNNPAGVMYDAGRMRELTELCASSGIWLISDEVYSTLAPSGTFISPASFPGAFDHCVTVSSVSKSHRMTGWRLGWVIARKDIIQTLHNLALCMAYGLPMFIQDAAAFGVRETERFSTQVRNEIDAKRELVVSRLRQIAGLEVRGSKLGMFALADVRGLGASSEEFAWRLLDDYRVAVLPCGAFGESVAGLVRLNVGDSEENLLFACEMIRQCAESFRSK